MVPVSDSFAIAAMLDEPVPSLSVDAPLEWKLRNITFLCNGVRGSFICDTGAGRTIVNLHYATKAGLVVKPWTEEARFARAANGVSSPILGTVDIPLSVQLVLRLDDSTQVYWDRRFTLKGCAVADLGADSPRSLYVAWSDWGFDWTSPSAPPPVMPLANLAYLVLRGAEVLNTPRVPDARTPIEPLRVILEQDTPSEVSVATIDAPTASEKKAVSELSDSELRALLLETLRLFTSETHLQPRPLCLRC